MKTQKASFGIIQRKENGTESFLLRIVPSWGELNLIGGKAEEGESPKETAIRELREELQMEYGEDYLFDEANQITVELIQFSKREQMEKRYIFSLFPVLLKKAIDELEVKFPAEAPKPVWVTLEEIEDEKTKDGTAISNTVRKVLGKIGQETGG